tara:strand:+ start:691 stop:1020 length:330 start_codon:yes stop_codon:yes gene_type:complete
MSKRKGYVLEKEVVDFWKAQNVDCERVFGSGAFKRFVKDLDADVRLNGLKVECKRRKNGTGFKSLYDWFDQDNSDLLVVRADRKERLYILKEPLMLDFSKKMGWSKKEV